MTDEEPNYLLSFDPGKSSGISLVAYNDKQVWLEGAWQQEGGVTGFLRWLDTHTYEFIEGAEVFTVTSEREYGKPPHGSLVLGGSYEDWRTVVTVISEKFTPLSGGGFNQTLDSVEPLRGEGALIALGLMPDYPDPKWRRPDRQYLYGGGSLAEKKRRAHRFLKETGFYVTGKDVGCKDANDARSAMLHGLSYLAQVVKHKPTYDLISNWTEKN